MKRALVFNDVRELMCDVIVTFSRTIRGRKKYLSPDLCYLLF